MLTRLTPAATLRLPDTPPPPNQTRLTIHTAGSSPHGYNALQELAGFDFETGSAALETPTFSKSGGGRGDACAGSSSSTMRRWGLSGHGAKPLGAPFVHVLWGAVASVSQ